MESQESGKIYSLMATLTIVLLLLANSVASAFSLELHFYRKTCPKAEIIVRAVLHRHIQQDPSIPARLLRLHFHDCFTTVTSNLLCFHISSCFHPKQMKELIKCMIRFCQKSLIKLMMFESYIVVQGCDGSILIDSTDDNIAEKEAPPNFSLRGFEVIDDIKTELEKVCPGIVSCADILALATRDSVAFSGGFSYALPTGRRDGTVSRMADAHIPSPSITVSQALADFQSIKLDLVDLTTLLGAHSIGFCHCGFFIDRLYNFKGTGLPDHEMDSNLLNRLRQKCPTSTLQNISIDPNIFMNEGTLTPFKLDQSFFKNVLNAKAILHLDQQLAFTNVTNKIVSQYVDRPNLFRKQFSKSMIKLGEVNVLTGKEGEIRLNCRKVNK
ncbi:hypothetical protein IEQ34_016743 [Dendrobium chrysotoxum]|uniref:Peroxidase n=1 Tax=Dendrobium chrysotoxum TaxID=161865 RepID=A0AAV7GGK8_DENCH|nr:hypothetical protein IEQ34_016743 [Dendrobium chrysotoxum]